MNVRIAKVEEQQFLLCLKHGLWGANNSLLKKWSIGDLLFFNIERKISAIAKVYGDCFYDDKEIWSNGLYWNRIPIEFNSVLKPENRVSIDGEIKYRLIEEWGQSYGWGILNKQPLSVENSEFIKNLVSKQPNDLDFYLTHVDELINKG